MNAEDARKLARRFIELPLEKRRIFLQGLAREGVDFAQFPIPAQVPVAERDGLSFAQQRMWLLWQLEPGSAAYNLPGAVRLRGTLDVGALEQAFTRLVERHETLRSVFIQQADERLVQAPAAQWPQVEHLDLSDLADAAREQQVGALTQQRALQPFDLTQGPLMRIALLKLKADEHVLLLTLHHIVADGWSMNVLIEEFTRLYTAHLDQQVPALPALAIQYSDYALWQRRWLEAGEQQRQLDYWLEQLGSDHPALELPLDHPRPAQASYRGRRLAFSLDRALVEQLRSFARQHNVTLFMLLLTAFNVLLHRYSGQPTIRVGSPIANRNRAEVEGLIGCFVNTQVLSAHVDGQLSVANLLAQVKALVLGAQAHQDLPFEQLVEALKLERDASRTPLFQVMYNHQPHVADVGDYSLASGLVLEPVQWQGRTTLFELTLDTYEQAGELRAALTYASDLFEAATIDRLASHWQVILQAMVQSPQQRIGELPMLVGDERQAIVQQWNKALVDFPVERCLHQIIAERAREWPDTVAVSCGTQQLTYAQLNGRANALAHRLIARGVGPDVLVGLAVERSLEVLVGLLAILKAGGAYVPLDPAYPDDRLGYMIADSGIALLLTQTSLQPRMSVPAGVPVLLLEDHAEALRDDDPLTRVSPDNLAYVIYTSGSTGKPKGTLLTHRNVLRLFAATDDWFGFGPQDVWSLFHSYGFDFSVWEIFGALLHGGRLLVVPHEVSRSPREFYHLLCAEGVTVLNQTPSAFKALMQVACAEPAQHLLRKVIFGGEALDVKSLRPWFERFGDSAPQLVNMYGITETTVHVTYRPLTLADLEQEASSPIGEPIADLSWYLLDADLNPVPKGCVGELYIGRAGLARGYLNRGDLSASRFVPDPFGNDGGRLYRSGDLARFQADGVIEYIGRIDHQLKIRGFRIELGEIEARLLADEAVASVVVLPWGEGDAVQLVAYLVPRDSALLDAPGEVQAQLRDQLKAALRSALPEYMVPAHLLLLTELPLTTNGKLDRKALPAPDASLLQQHYVAPQGLLEETVAAIWADLLQLPQVGAEDDFFALGGHSLLATQVVSRLSQALNMQVPLKRLFEHATLRAFAASLRTLASTPRAPLLAIDREQPLLLSYAQERQWYLWQMDPQSTAYHIPTALRLRGAVDMTALQRAFDALIARHETLRTTFIQQDGQLLQSIAAATPLNIDVQALNGHTDPAGQIEAWLEGQASRLFDLEQGPLLRVGLLRLAAEEHVLALTQHHIVSDAWSMQRMVEELLQCYSAFSQGQSLQLPALTVQYADYAQWQRKHMAAGAREQQLAYWTTHLGAEHELLELPLDRPRPAQASGRGATLPWRLTPALSAQLKALAQAQGATVFMVLLASLQLVLHRYSRQPLIRVGVPVANRQHLETEGLIGFFVNTQVMQASIDTQMSVATLLRQVRQSAVEAQTHQDLPFEQLLEALQPQRDASHHPLFQVLFNHQAQGRQAALPRQLPGLSLEGLSLASKTTQFDLVLDTFESVEGIEALFTYATDVFEASTIDRLASHWQVLLQAMVDAPQQRIGELPMLVGDERQAIVQQWNTALVDFPVERCLHQIIAERAREWPDAVAVSCGAQQLTYAQLNGRANALAHRLIARGVGPDVLVGLAVERSLEMLVGLLAILKAGGAYVPLDPAYPDDRLAYMIADSGIALLLTQASLQARMSVPAGVPVLLLEDSAQALREDDPLTQVSPDNLAYVIYTSGSTGKPKGTLLTHRNVLRLFAATDDWFDFGPQDVWSLFHSYGFDFSVWEIFGALLHGGRLLVVPHEVSRSPREFYHLLCAEGVTVLNQTPSAFKALMQVACAEPAQHLLRKVIFGGEALDVKSLRPWFERFGDSAPQLVNMYGITETTVHVTYRPLTLADLEQEASSPIGEPIADLSWYLLDADLNPVPKGCVGELYIGRAGLARGYLNRGDLSASRFVPDPFGNDGGRLYRTGDLARYQADGVIEYIGRIDHQLKIRGFRIELGEIEARLLADEAVASVVVLPWGEGDAVQLVAYLVPRDSALLDAPGEVQAQLRDQLKAALRSTLPDYMVPAHLLLLAELPLTTNGKLDRKALPAPDASLLQQHYVAPQSDLEQRLALIWQDVLGLERVGLNDDFFALGGHSLQLVMLLSRIRAELGVELKIRAFHGLRSLGELAAFLEQAASTQAQDDELDQIFGVLDELETENV
ncbi:amino acid adenylation domain-containing protein [Pseudomonas auratipiscis]|uniref:Amino acid adenylation domain-containing protein n=1 Tax=Pseudomonas auratipiscis TaxID=3115853 RepID=A0AB35WQW9_9PSED|nr:MULTISPECIES: amino acid adenylation domain-containing protein [unclassified Pseudomonas]MEE1866822.1 amino acid adenylation domain-containing protein [Pseudomonas sp. 120P]MEE1958718.1 amino acid adenylation domain-containing protein [Pseudomonas sp. 119P]